MQSISSSWILGVTVWGAIALGGCNFKTDQKQQSGANTANVTPAAAAAQEPQLVFEVDEIDLLPGAEKHVAVKSGNVEMIATPKDSGLSARLVDNALAVAAAKEAKAGSHLILVRGGNTRTAILKVNVTAPAKAATPPAGNSVPETKPQSEEKEHEPASHGESGKSAAAKSAEK